MHRLSLIPFGISTGAVVMLILYATLVPHPLPDDSTLLLFPGADKVIHAIMFCALSLAISFDRGKRHHRATVRSAIVIAIISTAAGCLIEIAQEAMALGRSADIYDAIADAAGACTGAFLWLPLRIRIFV